MRAAVPLLLVGALLSGPAALAEEDEDAHKQFTVSPWAYERLSEAHELIGKGKLDKAIDVLDGIERKHLNDHEKSLCLQARSHIFAAKEKFSEAAKVLEQMLALNALPDSTLQQSRYNLGQLHLALKQYAKAIQVFTAWLKKVENPTPAAYYTIAVAYTQGKQLRPALQYAQKAVSGTKSPQDSWLQLLLSLQFQLKEFAPATTTLKTLLGRQPKKKVYWLQLASAYEELKDPKRALAVMELAYRTDVLERPDEYVNLVQRLISQGAAEKGAKVLEDVLRDKKVPENADNLKLLANAWLNARERKKALESLSRLAKLDSTGKTNLRIAQVNIEMERWDEATRALKAAIAKGGLDNPGQAHLLLGTVYVNTQRYDAARQAFSEARKFQQTESSATRWLGYLEKQKNP